MDRHCDSKCCTSLHCVANKLLYVYRNCEHLKVLTVKIPGANWRTCVCLTTQEGQAVGGIDNVLVTAASRGIIQREHQRGALFYKNYSHANPFDNVTKDDLDAYRREVERKEKRRAGKMRRAGKIHS